jgi:sugar lactone lactonase YvrE
MAMPVGRRFAAEAAAMNITRRATWATVLVAAGALGAIGCGDDGGETGSGGSGGSGSTGGSTTTASTTSTSGGPSSSTGEGAGSGDGGGGGTGEGGSGGDGVGGTGPGGAGGGAAVEVIATFDAGAFELPEGLALRDGDAVIGFALTGAIETVGLDDGARAALAALPPPPPNTSFMTGVGIAPDGDLVAALVSFTDAAAPGLYRVGAEGGAAELWASHPDVIFPNGLAWGDDGRLFFTDSVAGGVFVADEQGAVEPWAADDSLLGDPPACGGTEEDIAVGANGVVWTADAVFVAGSDQGVIVRFAVDESGDAGPAELVAGPDCEALAGIDGIALDVDGTLVGAVNRADRIVRIDVDSGEISVIAEGPPLDFPASVAIEDGGSIVVTSFALDGILTGTRADPALVRVTPAR